jgi:putative zinc finger/helix-turn-helix YgiT family protein
MMKIECGICGGDALLVAVKREVRVGPRSAVVLDDFYRCTACNEELYAPGQMDTLLRRASAAIRADLGLLQSREIKEIRSSLDLSQAAFERLLGVGKKTVVRWEKGTVFQSRATDNLLRALRDVEGVAGFLSSRSGVPITAPRA